MARSFAAPSAAARGMRYEAKWESLDRRRNPAWFDDEKIGIFIHWSVFSVPAIAWVYPDKPYGFGGHSCWYGMYVDRLALLAPPEQAKLEAFHRKTYGDVPFKALAPRFKAEAFDPQQWAELFKRSGGALRLPDLEFPRRLLPLAQSVQPWLEQHGCRAEARPAGRLLQGHARGRAAGGFLLLARRISAPALSGGEEAGRQHDAFCPPTPATPVARGSQAHGPSFIYFDGEWEWGPADGFEMQGFLAWLYNESPCKDDVVVNDRFGAGSRGRHGGVFCSEAGIKESGIRGKWCEDRPLSRGNWSYNRLERLEDYLSERDLVHLLVETVAEGGNLHVDVSPCADGTIPMLQQERLVQMGDWLKVNGEAIYGMLDLGCLAFQTL